MGLTSIESGTSSKHPQSHRDNQSTGKSSKIGTVQPNGSHLQSQKSNQSQEGTIKTKKSSKNNADKKSEEQSFRQNKPITKNSSNHRLNIQIDSDLLYGSSDMNMLYNDPHIVQEYQVPISNKRANDNHGFDTFGESE